VEELPGWKEVRELGALTVVVLGLLGTLVYFVKVLLPSVLKTHREELATQRDEAQAQLDAVRKDAALSHAQVLRELRRIEKAIRRAPRPECLKPHPPHDPGPGPPPRKK